MLSISEEYGSITAEQSLYKTVESCLILEATGHVGRLHFGLLPRIHY